MVGAPAPNSAIQLPFIVVNTNKKTNIEVNISNDKMEYLFNFDDTFEIHDDMEVRMFEFDVILGGPYFNFHVKKKTLKYFVI